MTDLYREGSCVRVPLNDGDYALAVIARANPNVGVLVLYLFGPRRPEITQADIETAKPHAALRVVRSGDLGLVEGRWRVIGEIPCWSRGAWPVPKYQRVDELSGRTWVIEYADDDPQRVIREEPSPRVMPNAERDGLYGAGAVEMLLTQLLPKRLE